MKFIIGIAIIVIAAVGAAQMLGVDTTTAAVGQATEIAVTKVGDVAAEHAPAITEGVADQIQKVVHNGGADGGVDTGRSETVDPASWCAGYATATNTDPAFCEAHRLWAEPDGG